MTKALVIMSALAVLTVMVMVMVIMLLSVPVRADTQQHYHTTCTWSLSGSDKPLTAYDLEFSKLSCDTDGD